MIYGADVSNWQGSYAWPNGLSFGFAKATEGTTYTDGQFAHNWAAMAAKGMVRGAYHFGHPKNDPVVEAEHFLTVVRAQGLHDGDLLSLDLEVHDGRSASAVAAWARTWCTHVQQRTGIRPVLYTFVSFARDGYCAGLGAYPLWIADPSSPAGKPRVGGPWSTWAIHQYSDSPYDKDVSNLTVAQLRALGGAAPTTTTSEDDVPEYVSLTTTAPIKVQKGKPITVTWDKVIEGTHRPGEGIIPADPALATVEISSSVPHQLYGKTSGQKTEHDLGSHDTAVAKLGKGEYLYLRLLPTADGEVTPYVKAAYWKG